MSNVATVINGPYVPPTALKPGDIIVLRDFARTVTSVEYHPVTEEVSVSCDYATSHGLSSETLTLSAHEIVKTLEVSA